MFKSRARIAGAVSAFVLVAVILGCSGGSGSRSGGGGFSTSPRKESPDRPTTFTQVRLTDLLNVYKGNEAAGDKEYSGKWVETGGRLDRVRKETFGDDYVLELLGVNSYPTFTVYLESSENGAAAKLKNDATVWVSGQISSKNTMKRGRIIQGN